MEANLKEIVLKATQSYQGKSISQEELADKADINRNYVGMIERSENAASVDTLEKLAGALDVEPDEFFQR